MFVAALVVAGSAAAQERPQAPDDEKQFGLRFVLAFGK